MNEIVRLNVGGIIHTTSRATLCTYPESMLGIMFRGDFGATIDENGHYFIDRDGEIFKHILNFLRSNRLTLPSDFKEWDLLCGEADFYQIQPLLDAIKSARGDERNYKGDSQENHTLEIFEVRCDIRNFTPSKSTNIRTVVIGRKDVLITLPRNVANQQEFKELDLSVNKQEFGELQLLGRTVRMQLMCHLTRHGWKLETTDMSSSSVSHGSDIYIEHSVREMWSKSCHTDRS
ncbi:hypothetical protein FSP39_004712 [Pinctada imbricata]|uniref:BTB domain-containing protein n=1 Tax=Pinctada imbricata TaxID=66713 RepID=A0AA89C9P7_PINIB|nr:hypothetical protein FSP39_004712 [Pinctada imbricata]